MPFVHHRDRIADFAGLLFNSLLEDADFYPEPDFTGCVTYEDVITRIKEATGSNSPFKEGGATVVFHSTAESGAGPRVYLASFTVPIS